MEDMWSTCYKDHLLKLKVKAMPAIDKKMADAPIVPQMMSMIRPPMSSLLVVRVMPGSLRLYDVLVAKYVLD